MRVLVSVDMEGIAGVVAPDDIRPGHAEYERNRAYMTDEANAAIRGILAVEPEASVVVCDAHAQFRNLLPDRLDQRSTLVRGAPRSHGMVTGIEDNVDAVCFIGYHGRAGSGRSVLSHTMSGATVARVRCNGHELGELGLNAALAAYYDAAPVLATGDDTLAAEAAAVVPGISTVTVKWALGNRAAESLHPAVACSQIEAAIGPALAARLTVRPPRFDGRVDLEVDVLRPVMTELASMIPGVELRAPLTLGFSARDLPTAYDLIEVITVLAAAA